MTIQDIKSTYRIEEVIGRTIHLKRQATELVGNCIFHDDHHASLKVNAQKQIFGCFACGTYGDVFDFFTAQGYSLKTDYKKIVSFITENSIVSNEIEIRPTNQKPAEVWTNAQPPSDAIIPNPLILKFNDTLPSRADAYHDEFGNIVSFACRFDYSDGKKDVIPYSYKTNGSTSRWGWRRRDLPHPLFNLHGISEQPDAIVLVVEGEKTAEAAKVLFPDFVVTTWLGGKENVGKTDWSPLAGRRVYLWPDNDVPGILAMFGGWDNNGGKSDTYKRFKGVVDYVEAEFRWIQNSIEFPKKWDVADADWTPVQAMEYLKVNRAAPPPVSELSPDEANAPVEIPEPEPVHLTPAPSAAVPIPPIRRDNDIAHNNYFRCLGFESVDDATRYVFFVYRTNTIVRLSASGITSAALLQLAPLNYWEGNYPKKSTTRASFDINRVSDNLVSVCSRLGLFNRDKIRGRGAWIENKKPIIHCGDHLIIDGKRVEFPDHQSKYIYEVGHSLGVTLTNPLSSVESKKYLEIMQRLHWGRPVDAYLLAGWVVIAPLCGALTWRPHAWLNGKAGVGKTWVMRFLVKRMMGEMALSVQSKTTEAGLRRFLQSDAMAVVFDEAESETKKDLERMENILGTFRGSSSEGSGKILMGSMGGSEDFEMRCSVIFSSIVNNLSQRADLSRVTVMELKEDVSSDKKATWRETEDLYYKTVTDDYVTAFQSRAVSLLPVILKNAKTFSNAAASVLGNQRTADQLGALLAGAYSLTSIHEITYESAKTWIRERDWSEERLIDSSRDEVKIINKIMDIEVQVETIGFGKLTRTVGSLIINARGDYMGPDEAQNVTTELAKATLKRVGFRVEEGHVLISDSSEFISRAFANTSNAKNYSVFLMRIAGASKAEGVTFGSFVPVRATKIDTKVIFGESEVGEK